MRHSIIYGLLPDIPNKVQIQMVEVELRPMKLGLHKVLTPGAEKSPEMIAQYLSEGGRSSDHVEDDVLADQSEFALPANHSEGVAVSGGFSEVVVSDSHLFRSVFEMILCFYQVYMCVMNNLGCCFLMCV